MVPKSIIQGLRDGFLAAQATRLSRWDYCVAWNFRKALYLAADIGINCEPNGDRAGLGLL